jgi:hypothetical protein
LAVCVPLVSEEIPPGPYRLDLIDVDKRVVRTAAKLDDGCDELAWDSNAANVVAYAVGGTAVVVSAGASKSLLAARRQRVPEATSSK